MLEERLRLCGELWRAGVRAEGYFQKANDSLLSQFQACEKAMIPFGNSRSLCFALLFLACVLGMGLGWGVGK